jgi:hypothetical protein
MAQRGPLTLFLTTPAHARQALTHDKHSRTPRTAPTALAGATLPFCVSLGQCFGLCDRFGTLQRQSSLWRFGSHPVEFYPPITFCEWLVAYYWRSMCGYGTAWQTLLDSRLRWRAAPGRGQGVPV